MAIPRRSPGSAALPGAGSIRSASSASASRAMFPTCIATSRSTRRRSWIAQRSPARDALARGARARLGQGRRGGPLDPVPGRLWPRRQQRGDPALAAPGLRRDPDQHRAARPPSGPRQLVRAQGRAGADRADSRRRGARGALGRCVAVLSGYLGDAAVGADRARCGRGAARGAARCALPVRSGDRRRRPRRVRQRGHSRADARLCWCPRPTS